MLLALKEFNPEHKIPPRELLVTANLCRSIMDIGQKHINFGVMENLTTKHKTLVISNLSEVPLIYRIKKSGSIASLDLVISKSKCVHYSHIVYWIIYMNNNNTCV